MTIEVDYRFPPNIDASRQAKVIAIGQTAGTWDERFSHREDNLRSHLAQVINVKTDEQGYNIATVSFPEINVENDIASLLTMIFGKYSMAGVGKIVAVRLDNNYGQLPKFGISGIRQQLQVFDRPLIMAIFKPALGLSAQDHATILQEVATAGLDIIKDDEIMGDLNTAPTLERLRACRPILDQIKQETRRTVLYAINVTGNAQTLLEKARILVKEGANALLLNVLTYGFSVLEALAADPELNVPIFAHPALAGALCASGDTGFSYSVILGTLMAHAGADAVLYPAHYGSLPFDPVEEKRICEQLRSRNVFPVPSAGIHPGIVPKALSDYGNDVILNAGTGIMEHPNGPGAGVNAFFQALDWYQRGLPFDVNKMPPGALRQAMEKWA
ncbi:2,3-diketo-5-methylthiopentyl-1-phosphate enolase [Planktothrix agardhii]|jgi:2,3-diketo-5-methylthiopentyl-1-phosphate enolase|uniref:2,3-diketo-5-methylthiopentyl-1-phosphate enolase n=1 Tax=Planktothrix agardhii TaxID=1160 RepID=A0A1J1JEP1_PLAAG|nr:RuBisCO large subunit C-terminal-like domain-containing protein [Planktothrix agardhii]CAD5940329.1 2,3-diketo-5-methylthiopentyl-1-phosphate enolase [Planktothrix agardhii]CAD5953885.1 2,3-diketo-5-methylthiopentyl-1-phosphate enolase [Planktothrix agardhii]CAD5959435.1 2,3-diketo-5-methylthiopentyl-1-phosphate enolase [Planktothrix agardhii]CUM59581.1 2,3-diketo-5-methylthiopentyl-1-phosphate enolase [Planktothrix agardhii]